MNKNLLGAIICATVAVMAIAWPAPAATTAGGSPLEITTQEAQGIFAYHNVVTAEMAETRALLDTLFVDVTALRDAGAGATVAEVEQLRSDIGVAITEHNDSQNRMDAYGMFNINAWFN